MQNAYDINGRKSFNWQKPRFQLNTLKSDTLLSKEDFFNNVKDNIEIFAKTLYANNNDRKIRNIVDLILLRSKSDFEHLKIFQSNDDVQSFVDSIKKIFDEIVESHSKDVDYRTALDDAVDKLSNAIEYNETDNSSKHSKSKNGDNEVTVDFDEKHNIDDSHQKQQLYAFDENIRKLNACIAKTNVLICNISTSIDEQFIRLEKLLMNSTSLMHNGIMSVLGSINSIDSRQLDYIHQELSNVKIPFFQDKQDKSKKKMKSTIQVYGMSIDTKMIDDLSSQSQKTILTIAATIKKNYQKLSLPMTNIFAVVKGNVKYTLELIDDAFQDGFMSLIKKMLGKVQNFVEEHLIKPLKKTLTEFIKSKIPNVFRRLYELFNAIINLAKGAWKLVKGVFKLIWRFIKKIFTKLLRGFVKIMKFMFKGVIKVLKLIWRLIVLALKALWALVRWAGRGLLKLWNLFKKTNFAKKIGSFLHKLGSPFRWMRDKVVNGSRHLRSGAQALKRGISHRINQVKIKIASNVRRSGNFIKRQFVKVGRVFRRMVPNFVRSSFKRSFALIRKIPGKIFFRWLKNKIKKMVLKKALKREVKKGLIKRLGKNIGKFLGKACVKLARGVVKGLTITFKAIMILWTLHDLWEGYKWIKESFEKIAIETGEPDTKQPFWFEKWIWSQISNSMATWIANPEEFKKFVLDILKNIWEEIYMAVNPSLNKMRNEQQSIYRRTYNSFTDSEYVNSSIHAYILGPSTQRIWIGSFNKINSTTTNGYPTYFGYDSSDTQNILKSGLLSKVSSLSRPGKFEKYWKQLRNFLVKYLKKIINAADKCISLKENGNTAEDEKNLLRYEKMLLSCCAAVGITDNIIHRKQIDEENDIFYINYVLANNEAVNALRMLDYLDNIDEIKAVLNERVSKLRIFFKGKTINLEYIEKECKKRKIVVDNFYAGINDMYHSIETQDIIFNTKADEILKKLEIDESPDLDNDTDMVVSDGVEEADEDGWF